MGDLELSAEELAGDLPPVCARTGQPAELAGVWFARSAGWTWIPLGLVVAVAVGRTDPSVLTSFWAVGAVALPLIFSRGTTGRIPLHQSIRARQANLRSRRLRTVLLALLLTWVAVALWLIDSRLAGVIVLGAVLVLYAGAVAMVILGRRLGVRGRPTVQGGARLRNAHPDFVDAVLLRRTGHRP